MHRFRTRSNKTTANKKAIERLIKKGYTIIADQGFRVILEFKQMPK